MLTPETSFPYVGSYALLIDPDAAAPQAAELVRIMWRRAARSVGEDGRAKEEVAVSFPLRRDASGNKVVPADLLINAAALTLEEAREFHQLDRAQADWVGKDGRLTKRLSAGQKVKRARRDALRERMIYEPVMLRLLRQARGQAERRRAA